MKELEMRCVGVALTVLPRALNTGLFLYTGLFLSPDEIFSCCGGQSRSVAA
jgi:hypothetical protein